jgi:hypothetical protein
MFDVIDVCDVVCGVLWVVWIAEGSEMIEDVCGDMFRSVESGLAGAGERS